MVFLIGDVHGLFDRYKKTVKKLDGSSIQLGDMGVGFPLRSSRRDDTNVRKTTPSFDYMAAGPHRFGRGNHDDPAFCKKHKYFIPDGTVEDDWMWVGGAFSIDWMYRTEGVTWWHDEELSTREADNVLTTYLEAKPRIMLTHDCPASVIQYIHSHHMFDNSFTQRYLQNMFEQHQPDYWFFGHHHKSWQMTMDKTKFRCLNELEVCEI